MLRNGRSAALGLALASLLNFPARPALAQECTVPGMFGNALHPVVNATQRFVAVADLNADGAQDLLVSAASLGILFGVPGGSPDPQFLAPVYYTTGAAPTGITVEDFDQDGALDVVVACDGGGVSVFQGQLLPGGGPSGVLTVRGPPNTQSCWDVEAGDINADGWLDLVVALRVGGVQVFWGGPPVGGALAFTSGPVSPSGGSTKGIELAYFDGDQLLDVVASVEGSSMSILRGVGAGNVGTGSFDPPRLYATSGGTYDVTVGDFDRNGRPDVVSANYGGATISVFRNLGNLEFQSVHYLTYGSPLGVVVGDIDLDGIDDVIAAAAGSGFTFTVHLGAGDDDTWNGTFESPVGVGQRGAYGITLAEVDGNGSLDVVAPIFSVSLLDLFLNSCLPGGPITLTVNALGGGTVTRDPDMEIYPEGTVVTLTAIPNPFHSFLNWGGALSGSVNPTTITMTRARFITANFAINQYPVIVSTAGGGVGTVTRTPSLNHYPHGSTVRLTALPQPESTFDSWSGDASGNENPLDVVVDGPKSIVATFAVDTLILPGILSVVDVPLDQGGKVKMSWRASSWDQVTGHPLAFVRKYLVWREVPPTVAQARAAEGAKIHYTQHAGEDFFWEYVTTLPASAFPGYSYTAATTSDSTEAGNPYTRFLIQARNADESRWWDSAPDSGYSVDNLSPPTPIPFTATFGTVNALHWTPSRAADLREFRLYRGDNADFIPGPQTFLLATRDTGYVDHDGGPRAYKLVAVDVHGNLSRFASVSHDLPVATLASVASVDARADRIVVRWFSRALAGAEAVVHRRTETQDWAPVRTQAFDGSGILRFEDTEVVADTRYGYVLGIPEAGELVFAAETWVTAAAPQLAFAGVWPNPVEGGRLRVRFTLPESATGRVDLMDVTGRRVLTRDLGGLGPGSHELDLSGGAPIRPGVYLLRFQADDLVRTQRVAVVN